jgi:predicted DNA-binding transcriptional regulator YafY
MKHTDQRDRTLTLARILYEETDELHPISLLELNRRLNLDGIPAERKSLYKDLDALRRHGLGIDFHAGSGGGWYATTRPFAQEEMRVIIDAVQVYIWASESQREDLVARLTELLPRPQREGMRRPVALRRRSWIGTEDTRLALDKVYTALQMDRAMTFLPRPENPWQDVERQVISPKSVLWWDEAYHLLAWDHRTQGMKLYDMEEVADATVAGLPAQGPQPDPAQWLSAPFGLEPEQRAKVRLRCRKEAREEIFARFGPDSPLTEEGDTFLLTADVMVTPNFWAWLVQQSGKIEPVGPDWVAHLWQHRYRPHDLDFILRELDRARAEAQARSDAARAIKLAEEEERQQALAAHRRRSRKPRAIKE